jgi:DNA invertase Pin-like site-specific DNA recombinase
LYDGGLEAGPARPRPAHLVSTVHDLTARGIGLRGVRTGQGAAIDTTTAAGKLVFGIFTALAELSGN